MGSFFRTEHNFLFEIFPFLLLLLFRLVLSRVAFTSCTKTVLSPKKSHWLVFNLTHKMLVTANDTVHAPLIESSSQPTKVECSKDIPSTSPLQAYFIPLWSSHPRRKRIYDQANLGSPTAQNSAADNILQPCVPCCDHCSAPPAVSLQGRCETCEPSPAGPCCALSHQFLLTKV